MVQNGYKATHRVALLGLLWGVAAGGCASSVATDSSSQATADETATRIGDAGGVEQPEGTSQSQSPQTPATEAEATEGALGPLPTAANDDVDGGTVGQSCASTNQTAELQELALAFAFDVSGSMGEGDLPFHDKELKWDPVVAATEAFFESPDVVRVSASMVFFPTQDENRCDVELYATPDVPLQPLPSTAFSDAINEIFPDRGGTPTLAVLQATISHVEGLMAAGSTAKHAIVLITDGMPQGCSEETDSVAAVAAAVAEVSDRIPVYVVGIANPPTEEEPNPPDNVSSLQQIAQAGGTANAFLIDTGDPTKTITDFDEAIQTIRESGLSCELEIPEPPSGKTFDKEKVNVSLTADDSGSELIYSDDCSADDAWRYDDPTNPTRIVLCEQTCELTKSFADVALQVEFGCERRMASVK